MTLLGERSLSFSGGGEGRGYCQVVKSSCRFRSQPSLLPSAVSLGALIFLAGMILHLSLIKEGMLRQFLSPLGRVLEDPAYQYPLLREASLSSQADACALLRERLSSGQGFSSVCIFALESSRQKRYTSLCNIMLLFDATLIYMLLTIYYLQFQMLFLFV